MNLDFARSCTSYSTHSFHTYPAKMVPQIADALLDDFGTNAKLLFDPFCGSGTSLVEATMRGIDAIGADLNPLARLISQVKTTPIELQTLDLYLKDFYSFLFSYRYDIETGEKEVSFPVFQNVAYWFSEPAAMKLAIIHSYIQHVQNTSVKKFLMVAFSQTIRESSWSRKNEYKLYRIESEKLSQFQPDVFAIMERVLARNRDGLIEYMKFDCVHAVKSRVVNVNAVRTIPKKVIADDRVDVVLTSPPYGDSSTTVAYGQFSAHANQWLGFLEKGRLLDKALMGGRRAKRLHSSSSDVINEQVRTISKIDRKRALDVVAFYRDYSLSIRNVARVVKPRGYACYVVSNRSVRGVRLRTEQATVDFFLDNGFSHVYTKKRKILNKRMPRRNSPRGIEGDSHNLMNYEYVIVMQKE